jgi:hypothetical protein
MAGMLRFLKLTHSLDGRETALRRYELPGGGRLRARMDGFKPRTSSGAMEFARRMSARLLF